jgi:hypothetical protein
MSDETKAETPATPVPVTMPSGERRRILSLLAAVTAAPVVTTLFAGSRDAWAST